MSTVTLDDIKIEHNKVAEMIAAFWKCAAGRRGARV
jgi:hypothetical protein